MIRARIRHRVTKNAIQKHTAIPAMMMKLRGDTSQDVSETMRPNAKQLNIMARLSSHGKPCIRLRARAKAFVSTSGGSGGGGTPASGFVSQLPRELRIRRK